MEKAKAASLPRYVDETQDTIRSGRFAWWRTGGTVWREWVYCAVGTDRRGDILCGKVADQREEEGLSKAERGEFISPN